MKKMVHFKIIILLTYLWLPFSMYASHEIEWRNYIELPASNKAFSALFLSIKDEAKLCDWGSSLNQKVIPQKYKQNLYKLISEGNKNAFLIGLVIKRCLDAGELEDYIRSMGLFFEKNPMPFLKAMQESKISINEAKNMVTVTPYSATDDIVKQIEILNKRLLILESSFSSKYINQREVLKRSLRKEIVKLKGFQ